MIDKKISNKITALSLIAIIMVLYIHSFNLKELGLISDYPSSFSIALEYINIYIQNFISQGFARLSVPIFFIISGFLFFLKSTPYKIKIKKRFHTLLIPYLFWALFYVLIIFILQTIPELKNNFNSGLIKDLTLINFIFNTWVMPKNYPLWFLRDLILLSVFSPILFYYIRSYAKPYFIVLLFSWYMNMDAGTNFYNYKIEPILFFSFGSYLALFKIKLISIKAKGNLFIYLFHFFHSYYLKHS